MKEQELNYKNIDLDRTAQDYQEEYLDKICSDGVCINKVPNWHLNKKERPGFIPYFEEDPIEIKNDTGEFMDSLDFDSPEKDSFKFDDLFIPQEEDNYEDYETEYIKENEALANEVASVVKKDLVDYLNENDEILNELSSEDFERVKQIVLEGYLDSIKDKKGSKKIIREELSNPFFFDNAFNYYLTNIVRATKANSSFNNLPDEVFQEASVYSKKGDVLAYVISNRKNTSTWSSFTGGEFLSYEYEGNLIWSDSLEDAEIFDSVEDAREFLIDYLEDNMNDYAGSLEDYEIQPVYANEVVNKFSPNKKNNLLKESKVGDVVLLCQEFDEMFPVGNPHRDEYTLAKRLIDYMGIDKETAFSIASDYLRDGYFVH